VWLGDWPFVAAALTAVVLGALSSMAMWLLIFEPIFKREGPMPTVIASFAVSVAIQEMVRILATADVRAAASPFGEQVARVGTVAVTAHTIGTLAVTGVLLGGVVVLIRSRWALLAKAIFQDATMARALGVSDRAVVNVIFVGAALGGISGVGVSAGGAILLGVCQSLFAGYASASYTNALVFGLLVVVLVLRPSGLLTRHVRARV
jgi:branched-chain amino acid transport system permease protein